jgi:hypothetical protein
VRLRLLLPRGGRGGGLRGLIRRASRAGRPRPPARRRAIASASAILLVLAAAAGLLTARGDGAGHVIASASPAGPPPAAAPPATPPPAVSPTPPAPATAPPAVPPAPPAQRLPLGISEANPSLLSPGAVAPGFAPWRDRLLALHPRFYRLVVDWSKLQPDPSTPADLAQPQDGCLRGLPPCGPYAGIEAQLQAVRRAQLAIGGLTVVVVIHGVPGWAAAPAGGCERSDAAPRSRPITPAGLAAYRALLAQLQALGRSTGVPLDWWSPWNEPNHPAFISPQRAACSTASPTLAPAVYAALVRAARAQLGPGAQLVLGELAGFAGPTPRTTGVAEFVRALPDDVACAATVWAQHDYAEPDGRSPDAVAELERALAARPCTAASPIWVTETGVGGARAGAPRATTPAALAAQCRAQAALLDRWAADPRVQAVFQYTLREDTAYPVGLADARLTRRYPTYGLWLRWAGTAPGAPPPALPPDCRA